MPGRWPGEPGEQHHRVNRVFCTGQQGCGNGREAEMRRLSVGEIHVQEKMHRAVRDVLAGNGSIAYLLTTYTALWSAEGIGGSHARRDGLENLPSVS
ncbi:hypothetical protein [Desulfofundulus thermobenzoicus]|uniref:hypothetical protein n=1 Tax=Desulfofundulus thermobenzoicus TaxID=29376 RepID=UPI0018833B16|nr:hypothetical protein [Desulfofundulus thermobenzoicus]